MKLMNNGIINFSLEKTIQSAIIQVLENPNWVHFMQSQAISLLICR